MQMKRQIKFQLRKVANNFHLKKLTNNEGIGTVEVILILVVLIGLVLIFKSQLTSLVQSIFQKITSESAGV